MPENGKGNGARYERERERYALEGELDAMLSQNTLTRRQALVRGAGVLFFAGNLSAFLAACGGTNQPGAAIQSTQWTADKVVQKYGSTTIGDSWHSFQLAILADRAQGGTLAAQALGQKYLGISADFDTVKQISTVQNAFNSGIKGINSVPLDAPNVVPIQAAAKAVGGKYTTSYNTPAWKTPQEYGPEYLTYFSPDDRHMGQVMAEKLVEHLGGKGRIVHIQGLAGATAEILRTKGIDDVLGKNPGIQLVGRVHTDWSGVTAQKSMQTLMSSVGRIDGVIGADDDLGIGAYSAIKAAGLTIPVVSCDGTKQAFDLTANSFYLGTVNTFTHWLGGYATVLMFDALHGWKPSTPETMMFWQTGFIGKDKAAAYVQNFYGSTVPYDFAKMSKVLFPDDWDPQQQLRAIDPAYLWESFPKPSGYQLPSGFSAEAVQKTTDTYDRHWKKRNEFST